MNDVLRIARLKIALQRAFLGQAILRVILFLDPFLAPLRNQIAKSFGFKFAPGGAETSLQVSKVSHHRGKKSPSQKHRSTIWLGFRYLSPFFRKQELQRRFSVSKLLNEFIGHFICWLWKMLCFTSSFMEVGVMNHTIQFHYNRCFS